jgi:hypothetical protein
VTKTMGFKAWTLVAGLGLSVVTFVGCNPEEPAPKPAPITPPAVVKPGPKADEKPTPPAAAPAPPKDAEKK